MTIKLMEETDMTKSEKVKTVPICERLNLTLEEAAAYTGIGIERLRKLSNEKNCAFVLWVGTKRLIRRKQLEDYINNCHSI